MCFFYLFLILLSAPAFAADTVHQTSAPPAHPPADAATLEHHDAARLERQELQDREQALREQQHTTKTLLDRQDQYLQALRRQIQQLNDSPSP